MVNWAIASKLASGVAVGCSTVFALATCVVGLRRRQSCTVARFVAFCVRSVPFATAQASQLTDDFKRNLANDPGLSSSD